ncbi:hypothetical protein BB560_005539 [Smittium megazygosporum]|uniref:F-box domain-containing protein n=1 Tax=Smittium megazygosporum TaxID=133381 RepID=A0A2T9Z3R4_9FUNG|nr:hypothetical protein BB560_005539 [Smittium megazygosporum]
MLGQDGYDKSTESVMDVEMSDYRSCFMDSATRVYSEDNNIDPCIKRSLDESCGVFEPIFTFQGEYLEREGLNGIPNFEKEIKIDFISRLDYQLCAKIIEGLEIKDLSNMRLVSKYWNQFVEQRIIWKRYFNLNKTWVTEHIKKLEKTSLSNKVLNELKDAKILDPDLEQNFGIGKSSLAQQFKHRVFLSNLLCAVNNGYNNMSFPTVCNNLKRMSTFFDERNRSKALEQRIPLDQSQNRQFLVGINSQTRLLQGDKQKLNTNRNSVNWKRLYQSFYELERRWKTGPAKITTILGHQDSVYCVQFDESKLITGSRDTTIKIWDIRTLECINTLFGHLASVLCLKFDKEIIVSGSSDASVIVWCANSYKQIMKLVGHTGGVLDVSFNEKVIVTCSKDCTIKIWDRITGNLLSTLIGHKGPVNAISLNGNRLASVSGDTLVLLWDIESRKLIREFRGHLRGLACVQFDGKKIISGSNDRTIKIWDADSGCCIKTLVGHTDLVRTLYYSSGNLVVSGSYDQTVKVWDIDQGSLVMDIRNIHTSWVFGAQFNKARIVSQIPSFPTFFCGPPQSYQPHKTFPPAIPGISRSPYSKKMHI